MIKGEKDNIGLAEASELLKVSRRTLSRYIKENLIYPERVKSQRGTLEYRFNRIDLETFKKPERTEQTRPDDEIIALLKAEIKEKNEQIKQLLERDHETNIMLNNLQNQLLITDGREAKEDKKRQGLNVFFRRLFKG